MHYTSQRPQLRHPPLNPPVLALLFDIPNNFPRAQAQTEPGRTETALRARESYERDADSGGRRNTELTRPLRVRGGKTKHTQAYPSPSASLNMPFNKRGEALPKFLKSKNARNKLRSARPNFRLLDHFTNFTINKSEK